MPHIEALDVLARLAPCPRRARACVACACVACACALTTSVLTSSPCTLSPHPHLAAPSPHCRLCALKARTNRLPYDGRLRTRTVSVGPSRTRLDGRWTGEPSPSPDRRKYGRTRQTVRCAPLSNTAISLHVLGCSKVETISFWLQTLTLSYPPLLNARISMSYVPDSLHISESDRKSWLVGLLRVRVGVVTIFVVSCQCFLALRLSAHE